MGKNIVVCADGTGNTFDDSVSNITRMIKFLDFGDAGEQVAIYDQGIGTNAKRLNAVTRFRETLGDKESLHVLPGPQAQWYDPFGIVGRLRGLAFGHGLKENVGEMWQRLGELYDGPGDRIYLFGFSRGAFAARALAGLIYRCGLPGKSVEKFGALFEDAYRIYQEWEADTAKIAEYRRRHPHLRDCRIHFIGLYDTVKSYGGIWPILLPHLRHNPIVDTVRHALALDERRAWFNATTWGRLDSDEKGAVVRLTESVRSEIRRQDIEEVWFCGCHSHIGGGDDTVAAAGISLHWMMGEAAAAGLKVDSDRVGFLKEEPTPVPKYRSSFTLPWRLVEFLPRWEIDNSGVKSRRRPKWIWTGKRNPAGLKRDGKVLIHSSAQGHGFGRESVGIRFTKAVGSGVSATFD